MTRLLLAGALAVAGLAAAPSAHAECSLKECCVYPYDGGWCLPSVDPEPICVYPYDGGWCTPDL